MKKVIKKIKDIFEKYDCYSLHDLEEISDNFGNGDGDKYYYSDFTFTKHSLNGNFCCFLHLCLKPVDLDKAIFKLEIYYVSKEDYFRIIDNILNKSSSINMRILDSIITDLNNRILKKNNTIKEIYKHVNPAKWQKQQAFIEEIKVEELNYMLGIVEEYKKYASNN